MSKFGAVLSSPIRGGLPEEHKKPVRAFLAAVTRIKKALLAWAESDDPADWKELRTKATKAFDAAGKKANDLIGYSPQLAECAHNEVSELRRQIPQVEKAASDAMHKRHSEESKRIREELKPKGGYEKELELMRRGVR